MDGMFMDGEMYTAVSHNLAIGKGTLWNLYYTDDFLGRNSFNENPPLATWLLAACFYVFGSSIFVERFYILAILLLAALFFRNMWRTFLPGEKSFWWLPFFLFISVPVVHWSYRHNMMENTMVLWVMLSIIWMKKALENQTVNWFWLLASALATWAAFMTKGMAGIFTSAGIFAFWLVWRKFTFLKMLYMSVAYVAIVVGGILVLFVFPESKEFMNSYLFIRTAERIHNAPIVASRFWIIGEWVAQFIVPIILSTVIAFLAREKVEKEKSTNRKELYFFLLIGSLGLFPLIFTKVQRSFYLLTSLPFFAFALSIVILPYFKYLENVISLKSAGLIRKISFVIMAATLIVTITLAGKPKRDIELLNDVETLANFLGKDALIQATFDANMDWALKAYLMRKHQIQFVYIHGNATNQFILAKNIDSFDSKDYCKAKVDLSNYVLFEKCNKSLR
jgi:hypothetical protein